MSFDLRMGEGSELSAVSYQIEIQKVARGKLERVKLTGARL